MNGGYVYLDGEIASDIMNNYESVTTGQSKSFSFNSAYYIISTLVSTGKPLYLMSSDEGNMYLIPTFTTFETIGNNKLISASLLTNSPGTVEVASNKPNEYTISK